MAVLAGVHVEKSAIHAQQEHEIRQCRQNGLVTRLALGERRLRRLEFGCVEHDAFAQHRAVVHASVSRAQVTPSQPTVRPPYAEHPVEVGERADGLRHGIEHGRTIFLDDHFDERARIGEQSLGREAYDFLHTSADIHKSKPAARRIRRSIEHCLRQFVAHHVQELVALAKRPVYFFERRKVHAAMGDVLHDRVDADDAALIVANGSVVSDAGMLHGRVGCAHLEIDNRLASDEHASIHRFELIGGLGRHLPQRPPYVLRSGSSVISGESIVDVDVAQIAVQVRQADRRNGIDGLQVKGRRRRSGVGRDTRN